jgi:hypothetical protein
MSTPTLAYATNTTSTTAASCHSPASTVGGDMLLLFFQTTNAQSVMSAPSGWTLWYGTLQGWAYWKEATGTEAGGGNTTWTMQLNANVLAAILCIKGSMGGNAPAGQYSMATASGAVGASGTSIVVPTMTPTSAADWMVSCYISMSTTTIPTTPTGQTSVYSATLANGTINICTEQLTSAAATGTRTSTCTSSSYFGAGVTYRGPWTGNTYGPTLMTVPEVAVSGWSSRSGLVGGPTDPLSNPAAPMPYWLYDTGVGVDGATVGSANVTQLGFIAATTGWNLVDVSGSLSGTVTVGGVAAAGVLVILGTRYNGHVIKTTRTASDGKFSFSGLDKTTTSDNGYFAVAIDPNGLGTQYDSIIWDRLIPG